MKRKEMKEMNESLRNICVLLDRVVNHTLPRKGRHGAQSYVEHDFIDPANLTDLEWKVDETETKITNVENLDPAERHMKAMQMRQEQAQNWQCDCGTPLSAFALEEGVWNFYGQEEMASPDGETGIVEQWAVVITCPVCDKEIPVEPYDYALLAGDDAMITIKTKSMEYTALDRVEI